MSRSYRRTPISGITVAETEKQDKRRANRKWRRRVHQFLGADPGREVLPAQREVSDVWLMDKDGKRYFDTRIDPKWRRK